MRPPPRTTAPLTPNHKMMFFETVSLDPYIVDLKHEPHILHPSPQTLALNSNLNLEPRTPNPQPPTPNPQPPNPKLNQHTTRTPQPKPKPQPLNSEVQAPNLEL